MLKERVSSRINDIREQLIDLSHRIHANPELSFHEVQASAWITDLLSANGFRVETAVAGLPTAFRAEYGSGALRIGICAEYDALPGLGHACGHNIIAASSCGAAIALADIADELDATVVVLGTPAEESGSGKVLMLGAGVFDDIHAAMMVHPSNVDQAVRASIALSELIVRYQGKAAHASVAPENGVNAADALTIAQVAIGLLRQSMRPSERVHGITVSAGEAPNLIPASATARYYVRGRTARERDALEQRVRRCFEAGAIATGCELSIEYGVPPVDNVNPDASMIGFYRDNCEALGRVFIDDNITGVGAGSTDMGSVTQLLPAMHPQMAIANVECAIHEADFERQTSGENADKMLIDAATALAWTAIDIAESPERDRFMRRELRHFIENG